MSPNTRVDWQIDRLRREAHAHLAEARKAQAELPKASVGERDYYDVLIDNYEEDIRLYDHILAFVRR